MAAVSVLSVVEVPRDIKDLGSHECLVELRTPAAAAATAQLASRDAATASPIFTPAPEATSLGLAAASSKSCATSVHAAKPAPVISLSPAKCSMQFHSSLEHRVSASAAVSTLEKLDQMLRRYYITDFNHAYSIGVDVFYSAFEIHGVEMVFGKWISQCLMQFWPFSAPLIVKVSWLPSPFVLFASVHLRLRPLPWPFLCGSAAPEPSTMKHVPQLSWEEDRVLPWPTLKIGYDFGVHSVDSDLGLGGVPSSRLPLAWDPGGLGQSIFPWRLLFAQFEWYLAISPEFSRVPSNQRMCNCAVNLELPWLFCWNYGLIHWIDGMTNVPVVLLLQTFMLLPQQHGDGFFTVSNVQNDLHPWHPQHMQAEFEYCTVEVHPLPWPSFTLGTCSMSQAAGWNPPWPSFNKVRRCSVGCCCGRLWKPPWFFKLANISGIELWQVLITEVSWELGCCMTSQPAELPSYAPLARSTSPVIAMKFSVYPVVHVAVQCKNLVSISLLKLCSGGVEAALTADQEPGVTACCAVAVLRANSVDDERSDASQSIIITLQEPSGGVVLVPSADGMLDANNWTWRTGYGRVIVILLHEHTLADMASSLGSTAVVRASQQAGGAELLQRGTFPFIAARGSVQDGFAECFGGFISVVLKEMQLGIAYVGNGVLQTSTKTGLVAVQNRPPWPPPNQSEMSDSLLPVQSKIPMVKFSATMSAA